MEESATGAGFSIDQFVYGSDEGYKVKAFSSGVDVESHTKPFSGCFIPLKQSDAKYVTEVRALLPVGSQFILLSRIIKGGRDEYNRTTIANHTAMIPRKLLAEGKLSYEDVDKAMVKYENANVNPKGNIPKLEVIPGQGGTKLGELKDFFIRKDVERLMKFYKEDRDNRVFIFYKQSSAEQRIQAAYLLSMLLDVGLNLVPLAIFTDVIYPDAKKVFNLVLARSMISVKPGQGWVMLPVKNIPFQGGLKRTGKDPLDAIYGK